MKSPRHSAQPSRATIAAEVRAAMARADVTQGDLAEQCPSLSRTSLSERLSGRYAFNTDQLEEIERALGLEPMTLLNAASTTPAREPVSA